MPTVRRTPRAFSFAALYVAACAALLLQACGTAGTAVRSTRAETEKQEARKAEETEAREDPEAARLRESRRRALVSAVDLEKAGKLDEAIAAYNDVLATDGLNDGAVLNLSNLLRRRGRYDEAIKLYSDVLEKAPDNYQLRNNLGVLYRLARKPKEAEENFRRVLMRSPENVAAYKNLAVLYMEQDKLPLAVTMSRKAIELDKKRDPNGKGVDAGIHVNLGLILLKQDKEKPARAMNSFRYAAEIDPGDPNAYINIGLLALRYRDYASAEESLKKAREIEPNDPQTALALAYALDGAHKTDEAIAAYQQASRILGKESCEVVWGMAMVHKFAKAWDKTAERLQAYQSASCRDIAEDKVSTELKKAETMAKRAAEPPPPPPPAEKASPPETPPQAAAEPAPTEAAAP